jgi:hypothetical protein
LSGQKNKVLVTSELGFACLNLMCKLARTGILVADPERVPREDFLFERARLIAAKCCCELKHGLGARFSVKR